MDKTAIVIGATGLVGKGLTKQLLDDKRYERVKVFVRRALTICSYCDERGGLRFESLLSI
ncbi:MAG: hypothetical protein JW841_08975 [Deltaproteobacteria bacterium]|nr:hypothetical protein [Deltaproteobacteria bacterium]